MRPLACYIRAKKHIDWIDCALIETVPGSVGRPTGAARDEPASPEPPDQCDDGIDWLSRITGWRRIPFARCLLSTTPITQRLSCISKTCPGVPVP